MHVSAWRRTVMTIFVIALLSRGVFILTLQEGFYFPDSVDYSTAAVNLLAHGEFGTTYNRPPMYPLFLAGVFALCGQSIRAIRIVQVVIGACLAVVIAVLARRTGGEGVGALAGMLWSIYPLGVFIAGLEYPTSVAAMLLACAVLCLVTKTAQDPGLRRVVLGGILCGLAALTIPVVLATIAAISLWMMYWWRTRRRLTATLFLLGVALPLTPWTIRNAYVYGHVVIIEPQLVQQLSWVGKTPKDAKDNEQERKIKTLLRRPGEFASHFVREFGRFWELYPNRVLMSLPTYREEMHAKDARVVRETVFSTGWTSLISILSVGPMFFFALIGTGAMWLQQERQRHLSLLCMVILSFAIGYSFFFAKTRYRIPIEPYIIMLSAYGLRHTWAILTCRRAPESRGVAMSAAA